MASDGQRQAANVFGTASPVTIGFVVLIVTLLSGAWFAHSDLDKRLAVIEQIGSDTGEDIRAIRDAIGKISESYAVKIASLEQRVAVLESKLPR